MFQEIVKKTKFTHFRNFFTNSTKIKFVNFVGNYSYKVKNIEKIYFASYKVFAVCTSPENSIFLCVNKQENVVSKTISGKVIFFYMTEK
jgi:hypothetical protein